MHLRTLGLQGLLVNQMMRKTMIVVCTLAILALATAPAASAHIQVGNNTSRACVSNDHPTGNQNHVHVPGGATDQCQPPVDLIMSLLES